MFVSFFPLLVAGPIERAPHLLPQLKAKRDFNYLKAVDGLRQILWGLFKKIVIADNCAEYANFVFHDPTAYHGSTLVLGALFFTVQIYCDFSGYSDIALGTARLFGVELLKNFAFPYFSRDIAEFWRRWHISLSTWFRDYLYIPLGGSRGTTMMRIRNTFIIFIVSGFWHGANWTFLAWGALNAVYFLPLLLSEKNRSNLDTIAHERILPTFRDGINMLLTFALTVFAWIFFRAASVSEAFTYIGRIFSQSLFTMPQGAEFMAMGIHPFTLVALIAVLFLVEWSAREQPYGLCQLGLNWYRPLRYIMYYLLMLTIFWFGGKEETFIYFQF